MLTAAPVPNANTGYESFEPYVSVEKAARYLDIKPKTLLEKARKGEIPAYPWGDGTRRTWRFKISEIDEWMKSRFHFRYCQSSPEAEVIPSAKQAPRGLPADKGNQS